MSTNVYNIIWADDDIDALEERYKKRFSDNHLSIIGKAHNGDELEQILKENIYGVDAVIIDANFNETEVNVDDERDTSGLTFARSYLLKTYPAVPFFLFTQRSDEIIKDAFRNMPKFFEEFPRHKRWFMKNDEDELQEMFEAVKETVDYRKTDSFRVRNKFVKEFEAAQLIEDADRNLEIGLLYTYEEKSWKNIQDYFTPARKIVERIIDKCKSLNLLPPINNLNGIGTLLEKGIYEDSECSFEMQTELMPSVLAHSLNFILDITQDGSHGRENLKLNVDSYVREMRNSNLYHSIICIVMDLLLWFKKVSEDNTLRGYTIWLGDFKYEYEGELSLSPDGRYWYCGRYEIQGDKSLKVGMGVRIKWSKENHYKKGNIDRYVIKAGYTLLRE